MQNKTETFSSKFFIFGQKNYVDGHQSININTGQKEIEFTQFFVLEVV